MNRIQHDLDECQREIQPIKEHLHKTILSIKVWMMKNVFQIYKSIYCFQKMDVKFDLSLNEVTDDVATVNNKYVIFMFFFIFMFNDFIL